MNLPITYSLGDQAKYIGILLEDPHIVRIYQRTRKVPSTNDVDLSIFGFTDSEEDQNFTRAKKGISLVASGLEGIFYIDNFEDHGKRRIWRSSFQDQSIVPFYKNTSALRNNSLEGIKGGLSLFARALKRGEKGKELIDPIKYATRSEVIRELSSSQGQQRVNLAHAFHNAAYDLLMQINNYR